MRYVLLMYGDENDWPGPAEQQYAAHGAFIELLKSRGAYLHGEELSGPGRAVSLRKKAGEVLRTDGPFVETTEQVGGFYLIEARDLDEAIELAKQCPERIVEVRPVAEYTG
ncbi:YciI family protein [Nonomuraea turcica]|uniref:YciI family protein n=1 Tax=Nonomuraea sp. G32 TaxID=3067274 RepID=UPI00273A987E|nr:YciI family protein [Nonomuraea sp. G32]MDP4503562.1 YciI family protein [Nonomuraea sp. G32]